MNVIDIELEERNLRLSWADGSQSLFPLIWLRDNDPADLHPDTKERVFDLTSVDLGVRPTHCEIDNGNIVLHWPDKAHGSHYSPAWLLQHEPGKKFLDPSDIDQSLWHKESLPQIPSVDAQRCRESEHTLLHALLEAKSKGLVLVKNLTDDQEAGEAFGDLIGFKRQTNFGVMFEVISKPEPNNLAYTALSLPLHIDLTNQESIPGYQFLHCYANSAQGGESVFADGYKICSDLEKQSPDPQHVQPPCILGRDFLAHHACSVDLSAP
ncbi:MAG: TauD/TfdA family dioxygenase, partial [Pseudomonadota bacterium]